MSTDEVKLRDGTHELYVDKDKTPGDVKGEQPAEGTDTDEIDDLVDDLTEMYGDDDEE